MFSFFLKCCQLEIGCFVLLALLFRTCFTVCCDACRICRLLQISSFNGKMNALNEVNKLIANVTYNLHKHGQGELDEWLTAEKVAVSNSTIPI